MYLFFIIFLTILIYYSCLGLFLPKEQKLVTWLVFKNLPLKLWGLFIIFLGVLIFIGAELFTIPVFIYLLSLVFFLEGSLFFFSSERKIKRVITFWLMLPNKIIRIIGLFYLLFAIMFLFLLLT